MFGLQKTTQFGFVSKYHADTYTKNQHNKTWRNKTQGESNKEKTNKISLFQIPYKWYIIANITKLEKTKHKEKTIEKKKNQKNFTKKRARS